MMRYIRRLFAWIGGMLFPNQLDLIAAGIAVSSRLTRLERDMDALVCNSRPKPVPIYVIVQTSIGNMARQVFVSPDCNEVVRFNPQFEIPAGAYVSVLGPACIEGVTVGNMSQELSWSYEAPFAITRQECPPGVIISVRLKGLPQ